MNFVLNNPDLFIISIPIFLGVVVCVLFFLLVVKIRKINQLYQKKDETLLVDLELATVDQLLEELRGRPIVPYILVRPFPDGFTMESHNIHPMATIQILSIATSKLMEDLQAKGFQIDDDKNDGYDGWLTSNNS